MLIKMSAGSQASQAGAPMNEGCTLPWNDGDDDEALAASLKRVLMPKKIKRLELRDRLAHINLAGLDHESLPSAELGNKLATAKVDCSVLLLCLPHVG